MNIDIKRAEKASPPVGIECRSWEEITKDPNFRLLFVVDMNDMFSFEITADDRILINKDEHISPDRILHDAVVRMGQIMANHYFTLKP